MRRTIIILLIIVACLIIGLIFSFINIKNNKEIISGNNNNILIQNNMNDIIRKEEVGKNMIVEQSNKNTKLKLNINNNELTATLYKNSSTDALIDALSEGPITIHMSDYANMEKVGSLGMNLPQNNENINTEAGDLILYQGDSFVIYYSNNSWSLTRLGKIDNITQKELMEILGEGNVTVTLSIN